MTEDEARALFVPQKQPPTEPATPPLPKATGGRPWHGVGVPTDAEREQRESDRVAGKTAAVRATALELATQLYSAPASALLVLPANVFDLADAVARYIETGEHPA